MFNFYAIDHQSPSPFLAIADDHERAETPAMEIALAEDEKSTENPAYVSDRNKNQQENTYYTAAISAIFAGCQVALRSLGHSSNDRIIYTASLEMLRRAREFFARPVIA
jgi:hypothetical protein